MPRAFKTGGKSFEEHYRIRGSEVNPDQRANIITISNLLQVSAGQCTAFCILASPACIGGLW